MKFISTLFSKTGFLLLAYFAVGIAVGPPGGLAGHLPSTSAATGTAIHTWLQWIIWVIFWPIGVVFNHPTFTL